MFAGLTDLFRRESAERPTAPASAEMRQWFGLDEMASPSRARAWFEALWQRAPFTPEAVDYFRTLRLEIGDLTQPLGGGFWIAGPRLVLLRGSQQEAALHELAHAWWEPRRQEKRQALLHLLRDLADHPPADYPTVADLASVYANGIPTQPDPSSPTGYWRGMLAEENDHETFAGFCSGVMANASRLPPELRTFYHGLLLGA